MAKDWGSPSGEVLRRKLAQSGPGFRILHSRICLSPWWREGKPPGARYPNSGERSFAPFLLVLYAHRAGQHDASNGPLFQEWVSASFLRRHFQSIWTNRFFSPPENNNSPLPESDPMDGDSPPCLPPVIGRLLRSGKKNPELRVAFEKAAPITVIVLSPPVPFPLLEM